MPKPTSKWDASDRAIEKVIQSLSDIEADFNKKPLTEFEFSSIIRGIRNGAAGYVRIEDLKNGTAVWRCFVRGDFVYALYNRETRHIEGFLPSKSFPVPAHTLFGVEIHKRRDKVPRDG